MEIKTVTQQALERIERELNTATLFVEEDGIDLRVITLNDPTRDERVCITYLIQRLPGALADDSPALAI